MQQRKAQIPQWNINSDMAFWVVRDGPVVRVLVSHQCGPGSNAGVNAIWGLSLLLVLSFAPRGFSPGTPIFPSPQKPTFPNSNSTRNQVDKEPLCGCATSKSYVIIYYNMQNIRFWNSYVTPLRGPLCTCILGRYWKLQPFYTNSISWHPSCSVNNINWARIPQALIK